MLQQFIGLHLKWSSIFQVAAISGDARRALEICRRAAEIADYRTKKLVSSSDSFTAGIQTCLTDFTCHHSRVGDHKMFPSFC